jgi:uncharacterized protein YecE (DUF72 family)
MRPRIGTSGWHYRHWLGNFYPEKFPAKQFLSHYIRFFDTVELNGVFYRLPSPEAVREWYTATPKGFLFAYKGSRFITHMKKLKDPKEGLRKMMERAVHLREKLTAFLWQLPPFWEVDYQRLKAFIAELPKEYPHSFEFRHRSWYRDNVLALLEKNRIGLCLYSMQGQDSPVHLTSKLVYIRFHGAQDKYFGKYSDAQLRQWAKRMKSWENEGRRLFIYFNNDPHGHAPQNARTLRTFLTPTYRGPLG